MIILGRGTSLKRLEVYQDIDDKNVAIVNNFNYELGLDYIKDFLKGKSVTQFINRETMSFLKKEYYFDFNIDCILNVLRSEYNDSNIRKTLNRYQISTNYLLNIMVEYSKDQKGGFPTTGILSIVYSSVVLKAKDVYIIGVDFYDTNYNNGRVSKDYQKQKGLVMKEFLTDHIRKTPEVNYVVCTDSNWRVDLPNVEFV